MAPPPTRAAAQLLLLTAVLLAARAAAAPAKWTVFVYMLADNDLETYALLDMEEMMTGMTSEPRGCAYSACNATCGAAGSVATFSAACAGGAPGSRARCCPADAYPDVLMLADRGEGASTPMLYEDANPHADYGPLTSTWSTAKEFLLLPGGQWDLLKDHNEVNMADPAVMAAFLQRGLQRFPPAADGSRKYMLVFWDHGSGWQGYGLDHTCSPLSSYSAHGCKMLTVPSIMQGLSDGLRHPTTSERVQLDVLGFDACLMSMYELASSMAPFTRTLLGSELLEPGHGWDYVAPLRGLVTRTDAAGAAVSAATGLSTRQLAQHVIESYFDQARVWGTSGLSLALVDTAAVVQQLRSDVANMTAGLVSLLLTTPALAIQVLQKRTALGDISGADDNVDLGALLMGLSSSLSSVSAGGLRGRVADAAASYDGAVLLFRRDNELRDGTGMSIYMPATASEYDAKYSKLVHADAAALTGWAAFLHGLYNATAWVTARSSGPFRFREPYAVPFQDAASHNWITHGSLSSPLGLTASLLYGFLTPTGSELLIAGSRDAFIDAPSGSVVGSWSGLMFALTQDLSPGDDALDGLALVAAAESFVNDGAGATVQYVLQVQVYYASNCYAPVSSMKKGILKYTLDLGSNADSMQLFVSSPGTWGEVAPAQGGVIVPYLGSIPTSIGASSASSNRSRPSFGYSDCFKWGYDDSLHLVAFDSGVAAKVLGLDLARDVVTQLVVTSLNGTSTGLVGIFQPAQLTRAGCQCSQLWPYQATPGGAPTMLSGTCASDARGTWCMTEPGSCTNASAASASTWDFCVPATTLSGCKCHAAWSYNGRSYHGACASDGDPHGPWCVVNRATCPGPHRAHHYGAADAIGASIVGSADRLSGLDFDYCAVTTHGGCHCSGAWSFNGSRYAGTCRVQGGSAYESPGQPPPAASTSVDVDEAPDGVGDGAAWCLVDPGCRAARHVGGHGYDVCGTPGGRTTLSGARCELPALYDGIPLYDCISYNHSTPGAPTSQPWCFTNASSGAWEHCRPWSCSEALAQHCPAGPPNVAGSAGGLAGWAAPACLERLCGARQALANVSQCDTDSAEQQQQLVQTYAALQDSPAFGELLGGGGGAAITLDAHCNTRYGQLCVDAIIDPACPALSRANNQWMATTDTSLLCDTGCLTALCRLQEQAKAEVQGNASSSSHPMPGGSCADAELETLVRWTLMQQMDTRCGWPGPASLACNRLLSPPATCAPATALGAPGGAISDGAPAGGSYSANSVCSWTVSSPEQSYISLEFGRFETEAQYDIVTVEDFDGVIGMFSGNEPPPSLSTDTGLLRVNFSADGSVQRGGFNATYTASSAPQGQLPNCSASAKLLQVVLRTRVYGSELSWLVMRGSGPAAPHNIVMAGGSLPSSLRAKLPTAVAEAAAGSYKDFRSYYAYACLATGAYQLLLYDSYGDGWDGGAISATQLVNASSGCLLASGTVKKANASLPISITADADVSSAACSKLTSIGSTGAPFFMEAGLVILSEDSNTFVLSKQRRIKEALALLMDVDASQVSLQQVVNASSADVAAVAQWSSSNNSRPAASSGGGNSSSSTTQIGRQLLGAQGQQQEGSTTNNTNEASTISHQGASSSIASGGGSMRVQQLLQQESAASSSSSSSSRLRELAKAAVPVSSLAASGALTAGSPAQLELLARQLASQAAVSNVQRNSAAAPPQQACTGTAAACASTAQAASGANAACSADQAVCAQASAAAGRGHVSTQPGAARQLHQLAAAAGEPGALGGSVLSSSSSLASVLAADPLIRRPNGSFASSSLDALLRPAQPVPPLVQPGGWRIERGAAPRATSAPRPDGAGDSSVAASTPASVLLGSAAEVVVKDEREALVVFSAVRPGRRLAEDDSDSGAHAAEQQHSSRVAQQMAGQGGQHLAAALDVLHSGRMQRSRHRRDAAAAAASSGGNRTAAASLASGRSGSGSNSAARAGGRHAGAQQHAAGGFRMMGPKRHAGRKPRRPAPTIAIAHAAAWPLQQQASVMAAAGHSTSSSQAARQLLGAPGSGAALLVVARVTGYVSASAADSAAAELRQAVSNGTLHATLTAQGWPGIVLGLSFSRTARTGGRWRLSSRLVRIIIGVAVPCVAVLSVVLVAACWVRRLRRRGAAQLPGGLTAGAGGGSSHSTAAAMQQQRWQQPAAPFGSGANPYSRAAYSPVPGYGGVSASAPMLPQASSHPAGGAFGGGSRAGSPWPGGGFAHAGGVVLGTPAAAWLAGSDASWAGQGQGGGAADATVVIEHHQSRQQPK